jgi:hypothetical protein
MRVIALEEFEINLDDVREDEGMDAMSGILLACILISGAIVLFVSAG